MAAWTSPSSRSSTSSSASCARSLRRRRTVTTTSKPSGAAATCCATQWKKWRRRGDPSPASPQVLTPRLASLSLKGRGEMPSAALAPMSRARHRPSPCNLGTAASAKIGGAVADGRPIPPGACKARGEHGSPSAVPSNPNSRLGRVERSPIVQGGVKMEAIAVGIDVSKDRLDVHVHPAGDSFAVARNAEGLDALIAKIAPLGVSAVAVEATGGFETVVAASLGAAGLPVIVVNPAQVRAFALALGKRAKTDPIDAPVIARFVVATKPAIRPLPDADTRLLADLVARRRQIIQMIVAERQRERQLPTSQLKKSAARLIKALEKELNVLDEGIDESVRGSPVWC